MPSIEIDQFEHANYLLEHRGIRAGIQGDNRPIKTKPVVRHALKNKGSKLFEPDIEIMRAAARRLGSTEAYLDKWPQKVDAIPVTLCSDEIIGDEGVVYLERAMYSGRGRLCGSAVGDKHANQLIDIGAYSRGKKINELREPKQVECDTGCPMWMPPGEKSDCGWRAIVSVQLLDAPRFPSQTRYRTKSYYTILAMLTSLRAISRITHGVLVGIPLMFRQYSVDVRQKGSGDRRRIPVMTFDFDGPVSALQEHGMRELDRRNKLRLLAAGADVKMPKGSISLAPRDVEGELGSTADVPDDVAEDMDIGFDDEVDTDVELQSDVAKLYKSLDYTPARQRAIEDKYHGSLEDVLKELTVESGTGAPKGDWSPGEVGNKDPETEPKSEVSDDDDIFGPDDLDYG